VSDRYVVRLVNKLHNETTITGRVSEECSGHTIRKKCLYGGTPI
jgi:hypothetical protein